MGLSEVDLVHNVGCSSRVMNQKHCAFRLPVKQPASVRPQVNLIAAV
jgi:hypothetical protein